MKRTIKKALCAVSAVVAAMALAPHTGAWQTAGDTGVIQAYYRSVDEGTYAVCDKVSPEYAQVLTEQGRSDTRGQRRGIANVRSARDVNIIAEIDGAEYAYCAEGSENVRYYFVSVYEETYANDGFNMTGINYQIAVCADVNGHRCVIDVRLPFPHTVNTYVTAEEAETYYSLRFGDTRSYSHSDIPRSDFDFKPETIRVKRFHRDESRNAEIEEVDFKQYTYVVMCGEMCPYEGEDYSPAQLEYCKAAAMAARNFGWYKYLSSGANADFHLYDCSGASSHGHPSISPKPADQLYLPEKHGNPDKGHALAPLTIASVDAIWDVEFTNDEFKLFLSICANGKYNDDYKHSGKLRHQGCKYLAQELGMDYKEILHYYYDYATGSTVVGNGGKVHVIPLHDITQNETFNTYDATYILKYACGMTSELNAIQQRMADVNGDGVINTTDAVAMLRILSAQ